MISLKDYTHKYIGHYHNLFEESLLSNQYNETTVTESFEHCSRRIIMPGRIDHRNYLDVKIGYCTPPFIRQILIFSYCLMAIDSGYFLDRVTWSMVVWTEHREIEQQIGAVKTNHRHVINNWYATLCEPMVMDSWISKSKWERRWGVQNQLLTTHTQFGMRIGKNKPAGQFEVLYIDGRWWKDVSMFQNQSEGKNRVLNWRYLTYALPMQGLCSDFLRKHSPHALSWGST